MNRQSATLEESEILIDLSLVGAIWRRRARLWAVVGLLVWGGLFALSHLCVTRSYTATVSMSMQQPAVNLGALAALTGANGGAKNYLGVLRSRSFAKQVVTPAGLARAYDLPDGSEEAVRMAQGAVSLEDRKDGLLYLKITLPDRLSPLAALPPAKIKTATKALADAYLDRFKAFLGSSNSDRDTYLINNGKQEVDAAWDDYKQSVARLSSYVVASPVTAQEGAAPVPRAGRSHAPDGPASASPLTAAGELQTLYLSQAQLEGDIRAAQVSREGAADLVARETRTATLPGEDPLLADARKELRVARSALQNLRIELSEEHPEVVAGRERVRLAQARLQTEGRSVQQGKTSETVRLDALRARRETIKQQIADAEKQYKLGRVVETTLQKLQNDVGIRLEVWKASATQYASLKMQTVAGDSLMTVVDEASLPDRGRPGVLILGAGNLFVTLVLLSVWMLWEYVRGSRERGLGGELVVAEPRHNGATALGR